MWKTISKYPKYEVDEFGNVRNKRTEQLINHHLNNKGYPRVNLVDEDMKLHSVFVKRLVGENFVPNPENKQWLSNIDGDKTNNASNNLVWRDNEEIRHKGFRTIEDYYASGVRKKQGLL